ncbi:hypothetical protein [Paenibacillus sp.]|uniref:hypothetical protein n=1 Tax=Paenibacillus sp. TaxID=58172 RepID=UPI00282878BE|nr:hypothetical protein [Paenibacillus sp.]MDR0267716.1 hypothetical protein [Paenibacillus sp.]
MISATSSKEGDVRENFEMQEQEISDPQNNEETQSEEQQLIMPRSLIGNRGNSSGKETGAFHRLQTPASNSAIVYNGIVADSVKLPTYNISGAYTNYGEAAYLYTGVDGLAEVGFEGVYSQTTPAGWYPVFHSKVAHTVNTGDTNGNPKSSNVEKTYTDRSKKFNGGDTISGYKVYYYANKVDPVTKQTEPLTIREQINYTDIYVVNFGLATTGRSVKRVTAMATNTATSTTSPLHYGFTTPAVWTNMKFLINDSAGTKYPSEISGLNDDVWTHGSKIDYTSSNHVESYTFTP